MSFCAPITTDVSERNGSPWICTWLESNRPLSVGVAAFLTYDDGVAAAGVLISYSIAATIDLDVSSAGSLPVVVYAEMGVTSSVESDLIVWLDWGNGSALTAKGDGVVLA